jgi:DNA polymerase-1
LQSELPGILAWAVRGAHEWLRNGLGTPEEVHAATATYRADMDILGGFLEDRCVIDDHASATASDLYAAYSSWCDVSGERQQTQTMLGKRLAERGFVANRVGKRQVRVWCGVGLRDEHDDDDGSDRRPDDPNPTFRDSENDATTQKSTEKQEADTFARQTHAGAFSAKSATCAGQGESFRKTRLNVSAHQNATAFGSDVMRITSNTDLTAVLPNLLAADVIGIDVETTGLDPRSDGLQLVQLAIRDRVYLIDPTTVDLASLTPLLATAASTIVGHNLGFDLGFLHAAGLPIPLGERLFDTMLASQILDGGAHQNGTKTADPSHAPGHGGKPATVGYHSLAAVAHRWLGQVLDKSLQTSDWSGSLSDAQIAYAARDAAILLPLRDALDAALADEGLADVAALEFAALPAIIWMESTGVPIDVAAWTAQRDEAAATLTTTNRELANVLPGVNVDSPAQIIAALDNLGIRVPNAQETTLRAVADQHPALALILRRKEAKKRVSTYGDTYLSHVDPVTRRIHAHYQLIGAASGRMACSGPNMQNIPREAAYRRCIRPAAGRVLVKADYAQIELRIAAQVTWDRALVAAFQAGEDLHSATARSVLDREPTAQDRQLAKALNFGLLYGMGAERLRIYAQDEYAVTLSGDEAQQFRQRFFQTYPALRAWHRAQHEGEGTTYTVTGRPRRGVTSFTEKLNSPIQGTGADIVKGALARLWADREAVPSAAPVLVVHDEIVCEVDSGEAEACASWLTDHMTAAGAAVLTDVPVVVETHIVADWSGTPP